MGLSRLGRLQAKRPYGFCVKMTAVAILGLCFMVVWSMFSSSSTFLTYQRHTFSDIGEPVSARAAVGGSGSKSSKISGFGKEKKVKSESELKVEDEKGVNGSVSSSAASHQHKTRNQRHDGHERRERDKLKAPEKVPKEENGSDESESQEREEGEEVVVDGREEGSDRESEGSEETEGDADLVDYGEKEEAEEKVEDESIQLRKKNKIKGPVFDPNAHYNWKLCSTRSKHNYIPCIDFESSTAGKVPMYRHRERSCPKTPPMCLVPLPHDGYDPPVPWPESRHKIRHKNVAHPKLDAFIKKHSWVLEYGEYLTFPQNQSEFKGGVVHYLESIEEMVPDIEWGKNIRVVLDIGCTDSSFTASLVDKDVFTLTLGLKDDLVDLAQLALERGFPVLVSPFGTRRLPFPSGVFDAIHCGGCSVSWHSNGGKLLLEMNRVLRPAGYFILSTQRDSIEDDEGMTTLTASICWNILAYKTDETSDVGVKIYQKPEANDIYELRRKKIPPLCKENENPDAAWYVPMKNCLHVIPSAIEQRGTEWPEEWPKRLDALPEWLNDKEKLVADTKHWKAIVEKSYFTGMGIDWSSIRNVMDMKAIYGGFAAALSAQKVWVMNVVPVHAPDTLPVIYERGLVGVYHDWCESFGTYPRSYDLVHADHLFSRLKNRCKQNAGIVVEIDRVVRPGGWAIVRDKVEILDQLGAILRSMHWEIRMTYAQDKEGILCAQKSMWRP